MNDLPHRYVDPTLRLKESMARRLYRRSVVTGEISLPAVPGMIDQYVALCDTLFVLLVSVDRFPPKNLLMSGRSLRASWPRPLRPPHVRPSSSRTTRPLA